MSQSHVDFVCRQCKIQEPRPISLKPSGPKRQKSFSIQFSFFFLKCPPCCRLRVVPLSLSPSCVTRKKTARKKNGRAKSWRRGARERRDYRLSPRVCPFTAEGFFGVGFLILTSSYYRLLSITPGDILNKIALLYSLKCT